jgi:hypothetical protein
MFATFILERDYPNLSQIGLVLDEWVRGAGVLALIALLLWVLMRFALGRGNVLTHGLSGRLGNLEESQRWKLRALWLLGLLTGTALVITAVATAFGAMG